MSTGPIDIIEIADVCADRRALSLDLFRELGGWVTDADPHVADQRWLATACHRHAWHAELWAQRSPTIPPVDLDAAVAAARRSRLPAEPDTAAYRALLDQMIIDLDALVARIDPILDPSTHRVLTLVGRDLTDLRDH